MAMEKKNMFNREYIFKRSIVHCYVSLPEGSIATFILPEICFEARKPVGNPECRMAVKNKSIVCFDVAVKNSPEN